MRINYRLHSWWPTDNVCSVDLFDLDRTSMRLMTHDASKQDLVYRVFSPDGDTRYAIYVFGNVADAEATDWTGDPGEVADDDNKILAYNGLTFVTPGVYIGLTLANTTYGADMDGLNIRFIQQSTELDRWDCMFYKTASFGVMTVRAIEGILEEYTDAGHALDGFGQRIVRGRKTPKERDRGIISALGQEEVFPSEGFNFRGNVNLEIQVGVAGTARRGDPTWEAAKRYSDIVKSILADERRTLDGYAIDVRITDISEPQQWQGPGDESPSQFMVCTLTGYASLIGQIESDITAL